MLLDVSAVSRGNDKQRLRRNQLHAMRGALDIELESDCLCLHPGELLGLAEFVDGLHRRHRADIDARFNLRRGFVRPLREHARGESFESRTQLSSLLGFARDIPDAVCVRW